MARQDPNPNEIGNAAVRAWQQHQQWMEEGTLGVSGVDPAQVAFIFGFVAGAMYVERHLPNPH